MTYLIVTDEGTLTVGGVAVVEKDFARRSEAAPAVAFPAYSGTGTRERSWVAPFYNQESKTTSTLRGLIAAGVYAEADVHVVHIGDSKTNGSGPNRGKAYLDAYPSVFRLMLGAVEGMIPAFSSGNQWDDRWTTVGLRAPYEAGMMGLVSINEDPGPYSVTLAPGFDHSGGTFWAWSATGATITVTVDGGAPQDITVPAGGGFHPVTPTVTGSSAHSYQLSWTSSQVHLTTFAPTYDGPRLKVSRVAWGGSTAAEWVPGYRPNATGLWDSFLTTDADAIVVGLGTNSAQGQANVDALTAVYAAAVGLNVPVLAIAPGGLGGEGGLSPLSHYYLMYDALWDLADLHDIPMIDFQSIIGDFPTATAAGLLADVVHESRGGYAYEAAALKAVLT